MLHASRFAYYRVIKIKWHDRLRLYLLDPNIASGLRRSSTACYSALIAQIARERLENTGQQLLHWKSRILLLKTDSMLDFQATYKV